MRFQHLLAVVVFCIATLPHVAVAQSSERFGVGAKLSTLGFGIEAATRVTNRSAVRGSFNFFDYGRTFDEDGIDYAGIIKFRSVQVTYDQYLVGPLHISPGLLLYSGNRTEADASVPPGGFFTLGDVPFFSNITDPVRGTGMLDFRNVAPMLLVGIGNILPQSGGRFGFNVEAGVAFQGAPDIRINLAGTACAINPTTACTNATTDSIVRAAIEREQSKLIDEAEWLKYYPIFSVGFLWKF
jgi:hypothetical protein